MFVDRVKIEVCAGDGGHGCMSFRREKYVPRGGPDGGDGGAGGDIVVVARDGVNSLVSVAQNKVLRADKGVNGQGSNRNGKNGSGITLEVPPGTIIIDEESGFVVKDLKVDGEQVVVAKGGSGGRGNSSFKSSTNRAPREFTEGGKGERRQIVFELKVIADVGVIGKPNAGKSTLLSRLTRARPEIADYPFTTKFPNLGQVQVDLERSFVMADIPGLIEGAHDGVGLGHEFLRHIERAGILLHLVEPMPVDGTDPMENYETIRNELGQYKNELVQRPEVVAVSKAELPGSGEFREQLQEHLGRPVHLISAVTGQGLKELTMDVMAHLQEQRQAKKQAEKSA